MKKININKNTTKKLVNLAVKTATKKLMNTAARKKRVVQIRNSFGSALYRANTMIKSGNSFYKNELSMKEFKREYEQFGKRTGMLNGKNLNENLKTFLYNEISSRTPKQSASAAANLMKHLDDAVRALNKSKGGIETINDSNKRYIQVLIQAGALKTEDKEGDKKVYSIIKEKVPNKEDLLAVNNKYLNFKRILIGYFGDEEYSEAYGS